MTKKIEISPAIQQQIFLEAIKQHPYEACGFVLGRVTSAREAMQFVPCRNIQNELHASQPERYPRTAETAYVIDAKDQAAVEKIAKEQNLQIIAIFHSHPEHGVYFSQEDKTNAAPWGEPLFPEMSYLVVSVYNKEVKGMSDFYWSTDSEDFLENKIQF